MQPHAWQLLEGGWWFDGAHARTAKLLLHLSKLSSKQALSVCIWMLWCKGSWWCHLRFRREEQVSGEICIHSLPLPVLILKESHSFSRHDLHCSGLSQAFKTSLHPSIPHKKPGIFLLFHHLRKMGGAEWLAKKPSQENQNVILPQGTCSHQKSSSPLPPRHQMTFRSVLFSNEKHFPVVLLLRICQKRLLDAIHKAWGTLTCSEGLKWKSIPSPARAHPVRSRLVRWLNSDYSVQKTTLLMD